MKVTTNTTKHFIGLLIRQHRIKMQLTQEEFGKLIDVDRQYISKIENGKINLTLDYLHRIIELLNIDIAAILIRK